ncbi:MAG: radical SAM protein, partial [Bacteroidota bacterium]
METSITFKTKNNNYYLYNQVSKQLIVLHPILFQIIEIYLNETNDDNLIIDRLISENYNSTQIEKQFLFFRFLKEQNILSRKKIEIEKFSISEKIIKEQLKQITNITIEVTDTCNLNCYYCGLGQFYNKRYQRNKGKIPFKYIEQLFLYLDNYENFTSIEEKLLHIGFYGGEPLLAMDIIRNTVDLVKTKYNNDKLKYSFGLTTNGVFLKKYIDFFVEHNFDVHVSLDGNKVHNQYRTTKKGENSFETVFKDLLFLKNKYPKYFKERINFVAVLHNKNPKKQVLDFFIENFNKEPYTVGVSTNKVNPNRKQELDKIRINSSINNIGEQILNIYDLNQVLFNCNDKRFDNYNFLRKKKILFDKHICKTGTCLLFDREIYLSRNGEIFPCERIAEQYSIGSVNEEGVNINFKYI